MLKKFGMVTVGVTAGLLAVAPMASASEGHGDHKDHDKGHSRHHDHHGYGHDRDRADVGNIKCDATSNGDFENVGKAGDSVGASTGQLAGPILSGNTGQLASCNSFLNHNLSDNDLAISGLGDALIP